MIQAANNKAKMIAAASVGDQEMLRSLIAQYQHSDGDLSEVLAWACNEGQAEIVLDMLQHGVTPDDHCMFCACYFGHAFIVSQLLKCGVKMTLQSVQAAQRKRHDNVLALCTSDQPGWCSITADPSPKPKPPPELDLSPQALSLPSQSLAHPALL